MWLRCCSREGAAARRIRKGGGRAVAVRHKIRANDYLYLSGRIHAMENRLLTRAKMERMLDAPTADEAARMLTDCGYGEVPPGLTPDGLERLLKERRLALYRELKGLVPDPELLDVFRIQYDYHNVKVLLKSEAMGVSPDGLLLDAGRYDVAGLKKHYAEEDLKEYSPVFRKAVEEARELLGRTGDPQRSDILLDRAYGEELTAAARDSGSSFLAGYAARLMDSLNLKSAVRAVRMEQDGDFLDRVLLPGGTVPAEKVKKAALEGAGLASLFRDAGLGEAAEEGEKVLSGGRLTRFEKLCDDGVTRYLAQGKRVAFGEHPLIGYLYARETELTAVRILLTGKMAGLDKETIRERLRESYV